MQMFYSVVGNDLCFANGIVVQNLSNKMVKILDILDDTIHRHHVEQIHYISDALKNDLNIELNVANILNKQDFEPNENTGNGKKIDVNDKTTHINDDSHFDGGGGDLVLKKESSDNKENNLE